MLLLDDDGLYDSKSKLGTQVFAVQDKDVLAWS